MKPVTEFGLTQRKDQRTAAALKADNGNSEGSPSPSESVANRVRTYKRLITGWCLVIGTTVIDVCHAAKRLIVDEHTVGFDSPAGWEIVPYAGTRPKAGAKANAAVDLSSTLARLQGKEFQGGGGVNTARELGRLCAAHALSFKTRLVDTGTALADLREELDRLDVEYRPLGLAAVGRNLVLLTKDADGRPSRIILRNPVLPSASLNGEWDGVVEGLDPKLMVVIINSPKSDTVAKAGVNTARRSGAFLMSALTPSTSLNCRLRDLLANSDVAIANLAEFRELLAALDIDCPEREHFTSVPAVADALSELIELVPCGSILVTMGEVGQVVYDAQKGVIAHIGLTDEARGVCRNYLPATRINGIGDVFVANLAVALKFLPPVGPESSRVTHACRRAWMDLLEGSNPRFLHPHERWFTVRVISHASHKAIQSAAFRH